MLAVAALVAGVAVAQDSKEQGRIGPVNKIQPSGRQLDPVGKITKLGNLPMGGALTPDGRFLWTASAGRGVNDIRIVEVQPGGKCPSGRSGADCRRTRAERTGTVVQKIVMPGLSGGMAISPDGKRAYVSGVPESGDSDKKVSDDVPGQDGDVIHVFDVNPKTGQAARAGVIAVPPPPGSPQSQNFPTPQAPQSWPRDVAISPDGRTLLAALNLSDRAAVIDTQTRAVRYVETGRFPFGAAITKDGKHGLVSNEVPGTVSVIDLQGARKVKDIQAGPVLSHPESISIDPKRPRAYVAMNHQDVVAVLNTDSLEVERTLSVAASGLRQCGSPGVNEPQQRNRQPTSQDQCIGTAPISATPTPDGCSLLVANSGEDAVAVFALSAEQACVKKAQAPTPKPKPRPKPRSRPKPRPNKPRNRPGSRNNGCRRQVQSRSGLQRCRQQGRSASASTRAAAFLQREGRRGVDLSKSEDEEAAEVFGEKAEKRAEAAKRARPAQKLPREFQLLGRVPVGSYPVFAAATPGRGKLIWLTAKGLGVGPNDIGAGSNPEAPSPVPGADPGSATGGAPERFRPVYLPNIVFGNSGVLAYPTDAELEKLTPRALKQLRPSNEQKPPPGTPIVEPGTGGSKIEHVFYVVRENRSYDQVLGDDPRGDGDPNLTLFKDDVTPNAHALAQRFPLLDHVYANSEASIDGHFLTSSGAVSDYVVKNWHQNYAGRKRPFDFGVYSVTWPSQRFLFDQSEKQGIPYFNYGEAIAGTVPFPDVDRPTEENDDVGVKFSKSDLGEPAPKCFPNSASSDGRDVIRRGVEVFDPSLSALPLAEQDPVQNRSRFDCFKMNFDQQVALGTLPKFNYLTFSNNHTAGTRPGFRTPAAMIAENDYAIGQLVELISKSSVWNKSLIMVIEDDSQDGADHVDAHRIPAFVISPYAKKSAVIHTRYDFLSFIRTLELVVGMKPLNLFDATAVPMYDAFDSDPGDNGEPYTAIVPKQALTERNTASAPNARLSQRLPRGTDRTPQRVLDRILWQSVHGADSEPPPPGPNASGLDESEWLRNGLPATEEEAAEEE